MSSTCANPNCKGIHTQFTITDGLWFCGSACVEEYVESKDEGIDDG